MSTLAEVLGDAASRGTAELVFHLSEGRVALGAAELAERAARAAAILQERGVAPGDRVGILGRNRPEWAVWAWATWWAGAALVPLQHPLRVRDPGALAARVASVARAGACRVVVADPSLAAHVPADLLLSWETTSAAAAADAQPVAPTADAVLQFTSGSTSAPKGVRLPHAAVVAQMRRLESVGPADPSEEVLGSWVPFFHDLGLFWFLVAPVAAHATCQLLPTERFARDPAEWLRMMTRERVRATVVPPSGWAAALRAAAKEPGGIDLSALEAMRLAAETVPADLLRPDPGSWWPPGLRESAMGIAYGLAEAVLDVTCTPRGEGARVLDVDRDLLAERGRVGPPAGATRRVPSCGRPLPGLAVRAADGAVPLPEGHVGEVQVCGSPLMSAYVADEEVEHPFAGEWLRTGDLGFVLDGELYFTGRAKDVLIVMGHNLYPEDFEWAAGRVGGVRPGRSVAFVDGAQDRVVLLVEPAEGAEPALAKRVRRATAAAVGTAPEVIVVPPGTVEKTTSGKLRRGAMRDAWRRGELSA